MLNALIKNHCIGGQPVLIFTLISLMLCVFCFVVIPALGVGLNDFCFWSCILLSDVVQKKAMTSQPLVFVWFGFG